MNWGEELWATHSRYGNRIGVVDREGSHTTGAIIDRAAGISDHLTGLGIGPGAFVATVCENSALAVSASYAVALSGAAEVPVNPLLSEAELAHALACTNASVVLVDGADRLPKLTAPLIDVREFAARRFTPAGWPDVEDDAPSRIVFTSGTTGPAKGAIHTQRSRWTGALMLRAALPILPDKSNRILLMTPFSHGTSLLTFAFLSEGASVHLLRGVNIADVMPLLASGTITDIFAPPTVLAKIVDAAALPEYAGQSYPLRTIFTGTAPLTPSIYHKAAARFGEIIRVTYGKSEIFNPITVLDPKETADAYAEPLTDGLCVGWPATGVSVQIRDDEGRILHGEAGQIFLHSPHLSAGYMTRDGLWMLGKGEYHETGDMGRVDNQGRLFLVSRQSDMMKSGGYKISPDEVERALAAALPDTQIVVLGYPSDYWGEIVMLIAERPPSDWHERLAPALAKMTSYKRPRLFAEIADLPRNSIGKVSRAGLRRWLQDTHELTEQPKPRLTLKNKAQP